MLCNFILLGIFSCASGVALAGSTSPAAVESASKREDLDAHWAKRLSASLKVADKPQISLYEFQSFIEYFSKKTLTPTTRHSTAAKSPKLNSGDYVVRFQNTGEAVRFIERFFDPSNEYFYGLVAASTLLILLCLLIVILNIFIWLVYRT